MIYHIEVFFSNNVVFLIRKGIKHQYIQEFIYFFMFTIIKQVFLTYQLLKRKFSELRKRYSCRVLKFSQNFS
jgi:hypothetical protein